uniref:Auxin efflux carrier component n=1 Tax=Leersia perrieri TaxID=77586 RepID=A0A0D9V9K8_9ORYZ
MGRHLQGDIRHTTTLLRPLPRVNYRAVAADVISKVVIVTVIGAWARFASKGGCAVSWSITSFSLSTLTNSLVVGVPMARAMYGEWAQQLVVQLSVFQAIVWLTLLLFVLEVRKAAIGMYVVGVGAGEAKDVEASGGGDVAAAAAAVSGKPSMLHIALPSAFEGSVLIMSKSGTGMAMFSMGLFMAQQEKIIACGPTFAALGLFLKFALGPAAMAIGSIAVGLRGDVLRAALPQSITSFIFAKEYGLHADVLSTAVIFGMLVSLPLVLAFLREDDRRMGGIKETNHWQFQNIVF